MSLAMKCVLVASRELKLGDLSVVNKSLGKAVPDPKSKIDGVVPVVLWRVLRHPNITKGRECVHEAEIERQRREVFNER